jgi:hypothetical protein
MNTTTRLSGLTLTLPLALSLCGAMACSAGSSSSDQDAPPAGCQRTLCDFEHDSCQNPAPADDCSSCWDECDTISPDLAAECASTCDGICQSEANQPVLDPCGDELTACRNTPDNAICVDDIGQPAPDGTPCNDTASRVSCQCAAESNDACQAAIYTANPACQQCDDDGWFSACMSGTCLNEYADVQSCFSHYACTTIDECVQCATPVKTWEDCINAATIDPSDPGGCNSGSHTCWTQPYCNADGTSSS